jgi:hypothetical protein
MLSGIKDWASTVFIGFFVVPYWRCTWVLIDLLGCGQPQEATLANGDSFRFAVFPLYPDQIPIRLNNARASYGIGIGCLMIGSLIVWNLWVPKNEDKKVTGTITVIRFVGVYFLGLAAVNLWRGIWYWADDWTLPDQPLKSYWLTSVVGSTMAFLLWGGNSLLAPPSIFILDGPGLNSPPIAVTLGMQYYKTAVAAKEQPPPLSKAFRFMDLAISFILLPFCVVWFWRGSWLVLDNYLYGFTPENYDVNMSIPWSAVFSTVIAIVTAKPVVRFVDAVFDNVFVTKLLRRLVTYLLAWDTVSFWRLVWLTWDQFLGGTTYLSAVVGHVAAITVLTSIGCLSSICAPPSNIGVDSIPHPQAADDPLFLLFLFLMNPYIYLVFLDSQPSRMQAKSKCLKWMILPKQLELKWIKLKLWEKQNNQHGTNRSTSSLPFDLWI